MNTSEQMGLQKPAEQTALSVAASSREHAELQAQVVMARQFPRNEQESLERGLRAAKHVTDPKDYSYRFSRGGRDITGESAGFMRTLAACWGNIRSGFRVVDEDDTHVHLKGYCHDMETNSFKEMEDKFQKLVQRKKNGKTIWLEPDERDLRELTNKRGAILERNCIHAVLPVWFVKEAAQTAEGVCKGQIEKDPQEMVNKVVAGFSALGVRVEMLETFLGHTLKAVSTDEILSLRQVYASIKDGNSKVTDHFKMPKSKPSSSDDPNADIKDALSAAPVETQVVEEDHIKRHHQLVKQLEPLEQKLGFDDALKAHGVKKREWRNAPNGTLESIVAGLMTDEVPVG